MVVEGEGTLCCHFGGDAGGQGGCVGCAESGLDECSDDRAAQFQVVNDGFAAVRVNLCLGAGAEGGCLGYGAVLVRSSIRGGGGVIADSEPIKAVAVTAATVILVRRIVVS